MSSAVVPLQDNSAVVGDSAVVDFLTTVKNTHNKLKGDLTNTKLQSVLTKDCFSVEHLKEIGRTLELDSLKLTSSFKESYKILAREIHDVYNVGFAMVEGLHRLYTVRNVLEGVWLKDDEEPNTRNTFLQSKIIIRVSLLSEFSLDKKTIFHDLSLFTCNVKKSSVDRTIQDELSQLTHEIKYSNKVVDLLSNKSFYKQKGGSDKEENHILYNQRLFIYDFICSFILNKTMSTVLYKYHSEHVIGVMSNNSIPDKATYLAISPESASLSNKNICSDVASVVLSNIKNKALFHSIIYTRGSAKVNDLPMKPVAHEIKVIISYYNLASINMNYIKMATDVFSSNRKFQSVQTGSDVNVIDTMATIVFSISSIVDTYVKAIGLVSTEVYVSKVEQLLGMNLFRDVIGVVLKMGHYPAEVKLDAIRRYYITIEDDIQESTIIATLKAWEACVVSYLNGKRHSSNDELLQWKSDLFQVLQFKTYATYVRNGKFGSDDFELYTMNKKMMFSFFIDQVQLSLLEECFRVPSETEETTTDNSPPPPIATPTDHTSTFDKTNTQEEFRDKKNTSSEKKNTPESAAVTSTPSRTLSSRKATKRSYSMFDESESDSSKPVKASPKKRKKSVSTMLKVPGEVAKFYTTILDRETGNIPVTNDIDIVKRSWKEALSKVETASDLVNIWLYHKEILLAKLERRNEQSADEVSSNEDTSDDNPEEEDIDQVGENS